MHLALKPDHQVLIIAHRGASAYYPENTMIAFRKAVEMKADMLELDIQLSRDGIPVIFHDDTLERCTGHIGEISDYTIAELKKMDAGSWKSPDFTDEQIPALEEVLGFAKNKIAVNIEIKPNSESNGIEEKALRLVEEYKMEHDVLFSSFDPEILIRLRMLSDSIPIALLYEKNNHRDRNVFDFITKYGINAFNCSRWSIKKSWIKKLKRNNIPVLIYTVNSRWQMKKLIKQGVTGIFTNKPDLLRSQLQLFNKAKLNK
jgi:glycerophosphoryl diester phosphodiesterase